MRLLLDANLSPRIIEALRSAGHEAVHVPDSGLLMANLPPLVDDLARGVIVSLGLTTLAIRNSPIS